MVPLSHYLILSAALFALGMIGVTTRRNAIVVFMCVEIMLNAANVALVSFASFRGDLDGYVFFLMVIAVAASEVAVGLAIMILAFRNRQVLNVDGFDLLKW